MSPAEELRAAADRLEALAKDATPGPWRSAEQTHGEWFGIQSEHFALGTAFEQADATHIAAMHPGVGLALSAWLRQAAIDEWAHGRPDCCEDGCDECDDDLLAPHLRRALAVARAINGSAS